MAETINEFGQEPVWNIPFFIQVFDIDTPKSVKTQEAQVESDTAKKEKLSLWRPLA
ncbi:MAG: hypothetical protein R3C59_23350 [Planctomycetaceae bacterium]